ncbi:prepilin-type N-terminal cleavage/methylation domain-containing protein [Proteinivorax hydrogeniformans]|uniref:Prepilin-type N-terminal cleavage/methylation domain-containing protein n=1 Tax=Proteinivorax hydrogeniformans TaxID=1826727 RepID=A0AAU8HR93_9FIRM
MKNKGFTLLEVLVALPLITFIMIILLQLIIFSMNLSEEMRKSAEYQYNIRTIHQRMARDINRAIYKEEVFIDNFGRLVINYPNEDQIKYYHRSGTSSIVRNAPGGTYPISENITKFNYDITTCGRYLEVNIEWDNHRGFSIILKIPQRET